MDTYQVSIVGTDIHERVAARDHRNAGRQVVNKHKAKGPGRVTVDGRGGWKSFTLGRNGSLRYVCSYV